MTKFKICGDQANRTYPEVYRVDDHPIYSVYGVLIRRVDKKQAWIIWDEEKTNSEYNLNGDPYKTIANIVVELCEQE